MQHWFLSSAPSTPRKIAANSSYSFYNFSAKLKSDSSEKWWFSRCLLYCFSALVAQACLTIEALDRYQNSRAILPWCLLLFLVHRFSNVLICCWSFCSALFFFFLKIPGSTEWSLSHIESSWRCSVPCINYIWILSSHASFISWSHEFCLIIIELFKSWLNLGLVYPQWSIAWIGSLLKQELIVFTNW